MLCAHSHIHTAVDVVTLFAELEVTTPIQQSIWQKLFLPWSTLARVSLPTGVWSTFDKIQFVIRGLVCFWQVEVKSGADQVDIG